MTVPQHARPAVHPDPAPVPVADPRGFALSGAPMLSRATVDRTELLRGDVERQRAGWTQARVLLLDADGRTPVRAGRVVLRPGPDVADAPPETAVLLGEGDGVAYWAVAVDERPTADVLAGADWLDLRGVGDELDDTGAGLLTTAVAVLNWHATARFCTRCGSPVGHVAAGWTSRCTSCGHEEYPRTDPSMICLVHDPDDTLVLLARQPTWAAGRFTVLAGFVEAGESAEACVAREVAEEVGLRVRDIRYLGSQPWPFPRSLMLAYAAIGDPDAPLVPADGEIAEARWVTRPELRDAFEAGAWADRDGRGEYVDAPLVLPPSVSIARRMLEAWADHRP